MAKYYWNEYLLEILLELIFTVKPPLQRPTCFHSCFKTSVTVHIKRTASCCQRDNHFSIVYLFIDIATLHWDYVTYVNLNNLFCFVCSQPIVTGTSVLALKFNGGIAIAADKLGSYGSLARYRDISRLLKVNESTVMGAGGDYADFQFVKSIIEQRV